MLFNRLFAYLAIGLFYCGVFGAAYFSNAELNYPVEKRIAQRLSCGKYRNAESLYKRHQIELTRTNATRSMLLLAQIESAKGNSQHGIEICNEISKHADSSSSEAREAAELLISIYEKEHRYKELVAYYLKILNSSKSFALHESDIADRLAAVYEREGDQAAANSWRIKCLKFWQELRAKNLRLASAQKTAQSPARSAFRLGARDNLLEIGRMESYLHRYKSAEESYQAALVDMRVELGVHYRVRDCLIELGQVKMALNKRSEAEALLAEAASLHIVEGIN